MRKLIWLLVLFAGFASVPLTADCVAVPVVTSVSMDVAMKVVKVAAGKWKIPADILWAEYQAGGCMVTEIDPKAGLYLVERMVGGGVTQVLLEANF